MDKLESIELPGNLEEKFNRINIIAALRVIKFFVEELLQSKLLFFFIRKGRTWLKDRLELSLEIIDFLIDLLNTQAGLFDGLINSRSNQQ